METIRCRVEIYPRATVVPGIRIRIPESYVKRLVKSEPPYPQLSITTKGLEKEFAIQQLIIAVDTDFFLPEGKEKHQITTTAHGERKVVDDTNGSLNSYLPR